jgi:hypothetical protein
MPEVPPPQYLNEKELHEVFFDKKDDILRENCLAFDKSQGIVLLTDKETTAKQQSATVELIKKVGQGMLKANAIGMSLPCMMFEPRSETDRLAEIWRLGCYFLSRAANTTDKLERLKLIAAAEIAPNYLALRKMKSFNPLLGETFECTISDGSQVCVEQISHHPPITAYYVVGPKRSYVYCGSEELGGDFKGNFFNFYYKTRSKIIFRDGQEITLIQRPFIKIGGLMVGDSYMLIKGSEILIDKKNNLKEVLFFDYGEKKGMFSSEKTVSKDKVEGIIYVPKAGEGTDGKERRIDDLKDIKKELARIKGTWFEYLTINDINYWNIDKMLPLKIKLPANPLPSDCRYREDLIWLRRGNIPYADAWKDALEIRQRQDRALREKNEKK